jgi:hypothetical protein
MMGYLSQMVPRLPCMTVTFQMSSTELQQLLLARFHLMMQG